MGRFNFQKFLDHQSKKFELTKQTVVLYVDEFTRYMDIEIGKDAILLLLNLGYKVQLWQAESGRTFISKGYLKQAKAIAERNISDASLFLEQQWPILGIEPSAILSFRDEYKRLSPDHAMVEKLALHSFLIEEFLVAEFNRGEISPEMFHNNEKQIKVHVHCHQKSLVNSKVTFDLLNIPAKHKVTLIPSGCCGMAGSFGYEEEHYDLSMSVGALTLFPAVSKAAEDVVIAANGTSCRHQIKDGTQRDAKHPITILKESLL